MSNFDIHGICSGLQFQAPRFVQDAEAKSLVVRLQIDHDCPAGFATGHVELWRHNLKSLIDWLQQALTEM